MRATHKNIKNRNRKVKANNQKIKEEQHNES